MKWSTGSVLLAGFLTLLWARESSSTRDKGYVFTAPQTLVAGEVERGCLSLHNLELPAKVVLELLTPSSEKAEKVLATTSSLIETDSGESCLELLVPTTNHYNGRLRLKIQLENDPDYAVKAEKEVYINRDAAISFVETDKAIYKPGQEVKIRVLQLDHNLKAWKKPIPKVWIETPGEVRVAQWLNLNTTNGMNQLSFTLSTEPNLGIWRIKMQKTKDYPDLVHLTTFEVKKYTLPRFELTVNPPKYISTEAASVSWDICAKYTYGQPVKGDLLVKVSKEPTWWWRSPEGETIRPEAKLLMVDGCGSLTVNSEELNLKNDTSPRNIVVFANFTESGTDITETATTKTRVSQPTLKFDFYSQSPRYFKRGLPYFGKLLVTQQDDAAAPNEKIRVCIQMHMTNKTFDYEDCRNVTTRKDGTAEFTVLPRDNTVTLILSAQLAVKPTQTNSRWWNPYGSEPWGRMDVTTWHSPSDSYMDIIKRKEPIECNKMYTFDVLYTAPCTDMTNEEISFRHSINSRGNILSFGQTVHTPGPDTLLDVSEYRNILGVDKHSTKKLKNSIVHKFPLSIKVTPSMSPVADLLIYYVKDDGEIVAANYEIKVGSCLANDVQTHWEKNTVRPGGIAKYNVKAAPWSLCGISAVDKSTLLLAQRSNLVDKQKVVDDLSRFQSYMGMSIVPTWNCSAKMGNPVYYSDNMRYRRDLRPKIYYTYVDYVNSTQAFNDFGVILMSDLLEKEESCSLFYSTDGGVRYFGRPAAPEASFASSPGVGFSAKRVQMASVADSAGGIAGPSASTGGEQTVSLRSYFPETWLWEMEPIGPDGKATITRTIPHTITDWIGNTVCVSPTHGLGIASATNITAFQPFFLDYTLPYSVKRGETLHLKVSLFNYMQHDLPVRITLEDATGLELKSGEPVATYCVKARDNIVHKFLLTPKALGDVNITVSAVVDPTSAKSCGPEKLDSIRDAIVKPILVVPEGFPVEKTKSAFICPKKFAGESTIEWQLDLPQDAVPGSARAYVSVTGDLLGPVFQNLENLVRLPSGCGEQNMVLFAPNIPAIRYLDATKIENPELRARAIRNLQQGYQRELSYRHYDGAYSAFGPNSYDSQGSIWLTAFVVKSFGQARDLIHIDENAQKQSVDWIVSKQQSDGCFPFLGRLFDKNIKGGLQERNSSASGLTAYILVSLLETGVNLNKTVTDGALKCLEHGRTNEKTTLYTTVISTYALALLGHPSAAEQMMQLMDRATRLQDLLWWEDPSKMASQSQSIEMTAYAVLTLLKLGGEDNLLEALKAIRWMTKQRNAMGGFLSTQDTVIGLEAISKFAIATSTENTDMTVLVTADKLEQSFKITNDNRLVLNEIRVPELPAAVDIASDGDGCVLVQSNLKYNVPHLNGSEAFDLKVSAASDAYYDKCSRQRITACTRYKLADQQSNMAILEVGMISGYAPESSSLDYLLNNPSNKVRRTEHVKDVATIYFDKLTVDETCISFVIVRETTVDNLKPANIKLYDYYEPELTVSTSYKISDICEVE